MKDHDSKLDTIKIEDLYNILGKLKFANINQEKLMTS
jgi:hypothetical protein